MASEEDNFDIDIYGDGGEEYQQEISQQAKEEPLPSQMDGVTEDHAPETKTLDLAISLNGHNPTPEVKEESMGSGSGEVAQKIASTDQSASDTVQLPKQAPQTQGIKRKEGQEDDRFVDPGATTALFVSELHWWITDDDIRGWANQSQCEDELEDITFSEHKVNGKSKGFVDDPVVTVLQFADHPSTDQTGIRLVQIDARSNSCQAKDRDFR